MNLTLSACKTRVVLQIRVDSYLSFPATDPTSSKMLEVLLAQDALAQRITHARETGTVVAPELKTLFPSKEAIEAEAKRIFRERAETRRAELTSSLGVDPDSIEISL